MKEAIDAFFRHVVECNRCFGEQPILVPEQRVESSPPKVLLIGEQPLRDAVLAGKTGIDLDSSQKRLREFLQTGAIDEADAFFTTSVLCIPQDASLRGPRPGPAQAKKCSFHLGRLLQVVHPRLIIPLGHTSLQSLQWIFEDWTELRQFILNYDVGKLLQRDGLAVYPLLHPSVHTLRARSEARQKRDWKQIPGILASLEDRTTAR